MLPSGYTPATFFSYDGWNMVQEGATAATASRVYVHGGRVDEIVASQVNGTWYNHHYDAQGNCILLSTANGAIQEQYDYDAFGFPYFYTASGGTPGHMKTRFLFTGREWISDLRLYDYRNRQYHPELGRFLQPDPKQFEAGDYNLYRYCHNDPVNRSDPFGLDVDEEFYRVGDVLKQNVKAVNEPESFTAAGHGSQVLARLGEVIRPEYSSNPLGTGPSLSARSLVQIMQRNASFQQKAQIFLMICSSGDARSSVAREVAQLTGKAVIAPTALMWVNEKGNYFVAEGMKVNGKLVPNLNKPGALILYSPDGTSRVIKKYKLVAE